MDPPALSRHEVDEFYGAVVLEALEADVCVLSGTPAADAIPVDVYRRLARDLRANDTAVVYTSRGRFAEYDVLVREMPKYLRAAFLDNGSLLAGRWRSAIESALAAPEPPQRPRTDGAVIIADMICARVERRVSPPVASAPRRRTADAVVTGNP